MMLSIIAAISATAAYAERQYINPQELEALRLLQEVRAKGYTCPSGVKYGTLPEKYTIRLDCRLWKAAVLHSDDMNTNKYFSHKSLDGRTFVQRVKEQGVVPHGENLYWGSAAPSMPINAWLTSSSGHCDNMMDHYRSAAGIAVGGRYWTLVVAEWSGGCPSMTYSATDPRCSCILPEGETAHPSPVPTPRPTPAPPSWAPTAEPTAAPTPAPPTAEPTKQVPTKRCPDSKKQLCRKRCWAIQCEPDECLMWTDYCCGRKCVKTPTAKPTALPTPEPTAQPTAAPVVTAKPVVTLAPTSEFMHLCKPVLTCEKTTGCYRDWLPTCAALGKDHCGADQVHCRLVMEEWNGVTCAPHPDDPNATWKICERTWYMNEQQCLEGAAERGVRCFWVYD